jgi:predicted acylesterase/phospholipase RssA
MSDLAGARIWLSGSIPEPERSTPAERKALTQFVRDFSTQVFRSGGHIIHGNHPSFREILLETAREHQAHEGKRDCLTLATSRFFSKHEPVANVATWSQHSVFYETPEVPNNRDASLARLRRWMACRSDAIVVVGGKWWEHLPGRAGVPQEIELALERHLPGFLLGAFGGAAQGYLDQHLDLWPRLKNGLDAAANRGIATEQDVEWLVAAVYTQLTRLPLVRGRGEDGASFRILALDGGGIKGTFTAAILAAWEEQTKRRIVDHFDLVAGTSTGGILAIGLGLGITAKQMLEFYQKRGPLLFPVKTRWGQIRYGIRHLFSPKYSQEVLLAELQDAYNPDGKTRRLNDSRCRLIIPCYRAITGGTYALRTPHSARHATNGGLKATEAALATAAAPTYFTAARIKDLVAESVYFDGGVWANNPATAAILEAVCNLGVPIDRIDILSVGCTGETFTVRGQARAGLLGWASRLRIIKLLMHAQESACEEQAKQLVGVTNYLRVNHVVSPDTYHLDGVGDINELATAGQDKALEAETLTQVQSRFLNGVHVGKWQNFEPAAATGLAHIPSA